jgi:hypothetical protein
MGQLERKELKKNEPFVCRKRSEWLKRWNERSITVLEGGMGSMNRSMLAWSGGATPGWISLDEKFTVALERASDGPRVAVAGDTRWNEDTLVLRREGRTLVFRPSVGGPSLSDIKSAILGAQGRSDRPTACASEDASPHDTLVRVKTSPDVKRTKPRGESPRDDAKVRYEGERSAAGQREGRGTAWYDGGETYTGEWLADQKHGSGKYTFSSGAQYEGAWSNGDASGRGVYRFAGGDVYEGEVAAAKAQGDGVMRYASGDVHS